MVVALPLACTFGSGGVATSTQLGDGESDGGASTETGSLNHGAGSDDTVGGQTGSDDNAPATITTPTGLATDDGDDDDSTDDATGDETTGTAPVDCSAPPFYKEIIQATDAFEGPPMQKWPLPSVPGMEIVASEVAEQGTAAFLWNAPCQDDYVLWAYVWDQTEGASTNDPDSYFIQLDDGGETFWRYGCQTIDILDPQPAWHWLRVQESITCLDLQDVTYSTDASMHAFTFRNREAGTYDQDNPPGEVAAIARILVTNDPTYEPADSE